MIRTLVVFIALYSLTLPLGAHQKLLVLAEQWVPYAYQDEEQIVGVSADLVEATLKRSGLPYQHEIWPWARAYKALQDKPYTILHSTSRTVERENLFHWIGPLYPRQLIAYKLKRRTDIQATTFNELKQYQFGVLRDGSSHELMKSKGFVKDKHYITVSADQQNIRLLFQGRIDLISSGNILIVHQLKALGFNFDELEAVMPLTPKGGYYMALNKDTPKDVVDKLNQAFEQVVNEGLREELRRRYLQ